MPEQFTPAHEPGNRFARSCVDFQSPISEGKGDYAFETTVGSTASRMPLLVFNTLVVQERTEHDKIGQKAAEGLDDGARDAAHEWAVGRLDTPTRAIR